MNIETRKRGCLVPTVRKKPAGACQQTMVDRVEALLARTGSCLPSSYRLLGDVVGRGTAVAVSGVSVGILGLILTQLGGGATFVGFIVGLIGVGISFSGVFDEAGL